VKITKASVLAAAIAVGALVATTGTANAATPAPAQQVCFGSVCTKIEPGGTAVVVRDPSSAATTSATLGPGAGPFNALVSTGSGGSTSQTTVIGAGSKLNALTTTATGGSEAYAYVENGSLNALSSTATANGYAAVSAFGSGNQLSASGSRAGASDVFVSGNNNKITTTASGDNSTASVVLYGSNNTQTLSATNGGHASYDISVNFTGSSGEVAGLYRNNIDRLTGSNGAIARRFESHVDNGVISGNTNIVTADGVNALAEGGVAAGSGGGFGGASWGNTTKASAAGVGSHAVAIAGDVGSQFDKAIEIPTQAIPAGNPNGLPTSVVAANAVNTTATAVATGGGEAISRTSGLRTAASSTADGLASAATSIATGTASSATSKAASAGTATAVASGGGVASATATRTGGSTAIAYAAGNGVSPNGGVVAVATDTNTQRIATLNGLSGSTSCGMGAHGYAAVTDSGGSKMAIC